LGHGDIFQALQVVQSVEMDLDAAVACDGHARPGSSSKLLGSFTPPSATMAGLFRTMASAITGVIEPAKLVERRRRIED
jgi:hypothetical protein